MINDSYNQTRLQSIDEHIEDYVDGLLSARQLEEALSPLCLGLPELRAFLRQALDEKIEAEMEQAS